MELTREELNEIIYKIRMSVRNSSIREIELLKARMYGLEIEIKKLKGE